MFSGIVKEIGIVRKLDYKNEILDFTVACKDLKSKIKIGDSIAIDGCCQTVVKIKNPKSKRQLFCFKVQATGETLERTNFLKLKVGSKVNLEIPLNYGEKIGGHLVTGHVDAIGEISDISTSGENTIVKVKYQNNLRDFVASKGSMAVNGVSLTIIESGNAHFSFTLIPYTRDNTNLGFLKVGDLVNLEVDLVSRYLVNILKNKD